MTTKFSVNKSMRAALAVFSCALLLPVSSAQAFLGKNRTGGMSEIYLGDTKIKVEGGFVDSYDDQDIHLRAKGLEITINIDNTTGEDKNYRFIVHNINAEITKIVGFENEGAITREKNSLSFTTPVKGKKVTVFKLTPQVPEDGFLFMVFGESQGGDHVLRRILGDVNYRKPLFVISCGDMVEDGTSGAYQDFLKKTIDVQVPFLTVPGSSEVDGEGRKTYEDYLGARYYSFDFRNAHFIVLDNGDNRLSEEQFRWLENDLMNNKAISTFVFMHLPPFDPRPGRERPMSLGSQYRRLSTILERHKVTRVFTSGIHGYFREEKGGVPYVITGGGGSELASADAYFNYVIVEVSQDKVKDKLIKLASPPIGWLEGIKLKANLYVKNSFHAHPVRTAILLGVLALVAFSVVRGVYYRMFGRPKRRLSL